MSILTAILRFSEKVTLGVVELNARRHTDRVADVDHITSWQDDCGGWSRLGCWCVDALRLAECFGPGADGE